jgi:hypothetical protein
VYSIAGRRNSVQVFVPTTLAGPIVGRSLERFYDAVDELIAESKNVNASPEKSFRHIIMRTYGPYQQGDGNLMKALGELGEIP